MATGSTQAEAMKAYKALLAENGIDNGKNDGDAPEEEAEALVATVASIDTYTVDGNTVFYFVTSDGIYFKGMLKDNEDLIFISVGDTVEFTYEDTENERIKDIISYKTATAD